MKATLFRVSALAGLMLILTACPYQSRVPISKPVEKINKDLLGYWIASGEMEYGEEATYFEIGKFDKVKYEIIEHSYSTYDSTWSEKKYHMHTSMVGDETFMNIQEDGMGDYHLHKLEIDVAGKSKQLTVYEVTDNIDETFNTSEDLKAFIEKHKGLSFFYTSDETIYFPHKPAKKK